MLGQSYKVAKTEYGLQLAKKSNAANKENRAQQGY
jgi:hypothetical protein